MVTIDYGTYNRLGNIMFMWSAATVFCKKHNFKLNASKTLPAFKNKPDDLEPVNTGFGEDNCSIQVEYYQGKRYFDNPVIPVDNKNIMALIRAPYVMDARYHFCDYFQLKELVTDHRQDIKNFVEEIEGGPIVPENASSRKLKIINTIIGMTK